MVWAGWWGTRSRSAGQQSGVSLRPGRAAADAAENGGPRVCTDHSVAHDHDERAIGPRGVNVAFQRCPGRSGGWHVVVGAAGRHGGSPALAEDISDTSARARSLFAIKRVSGRTDARIRGVGRRTERRGEPRLSRRSPRSSSAAHASADVAYSPFARYKTKSRQRWPCRQPQASNSPFELFHGVLSPGRVASTAGFDSDRRHPWPGRGLAWAGRGSSKAAS